MEFPKINTAKPDVYKATRQKTTCAVGKGIKLIKNQIKKMMENIKYKTRQMHCTVKCPHQMKAIYQGVEYLVAVGSYLEIECPFYNGKDRNKKIVKCSYIPNTFDIYYAIL